MSGSREQLADMTIASDEDVILARQRVRAAAQQLGFGALDQTRLVTAVSELGRNIVVHAGEGNMALYHLLEEGREGVEAVFSDNGPGIGNIEMALTDGYSTAGSMGLGLRGASRLVDDFDIESTPGAGTRVTIRKWI